MPRKSKVVIKKIELEGFRRGPNQTFLDSRQGKDNWKRNALKGMANVTTGQRGKCVYVSG